MMLNPDVTVRGQGVMEKCSFCVQRIETARQPAKDEGRPIGDGEVLTACQQTCASQAITFGNVREPWREPDDVEPDHGPTSIRQESLSEFSWSRNGELSLRGASSQCRTRERIRGGVARREFRTVASRRSAEIWRGARATPYCMPNLPAKVFKYHTGRAVTTQSNSLLAVATIVFLGATATVSRASANDTSTVTVLDRDITAWSRLATTGPMAQRLAAISTLAEFDGAAHDVLVGLLADPSASVRYRAIVALDPTDPLPPTAVAAVKRRLDDESAIVRVAAAETLLGTDDDEALDRLAGLAHDENFRVRLAALWALVRAGDGAARAWPDVSELVNDKNNYVRNVARQLERRFGHSDEPST